MKCSTPDGDEKLQGQTAANFGGAHVLVDLTKLGVFQGIYLRDATSSQIPSCFSDLFKGSGGSASKAGLKIELSYDIKGDKIDIEFRDGASSDSTSKDVEFEQDGLYLQDLGYFKLKRFKKIISRNAYFISRYKYPTNIYDHVDDSKRKRTEKQKDKQITLKTLNNCAILSPCDFNFIFFVYFRKNAPDYIDLSGHLVFYEYFCISNNSNIL